MINFERIRDLNNSIKKNKDKLKTETEFQKKEVLKLKIQIDDLRIKIERLKY